MLRTIVNRRLPVISWLSAALLFGSAGCGSGHHSVTEATFTSTYTFATKSEVQVAVQPDGAVYDVVADPNGVSNDLVRFEDFGRGAESVITVLPAGVHIPPYGHLAVSPLNGNIYVPIGISPDPLSLNVYSPTGVLLFTITDPDFNGANEVAFAAVAVDSVGSAYVLDANYVITYDAAGNLLGQFFAPYDSSDPYRGVTIDSKDQLYLLGHTHVAVYTTSGVEKNQIPVLSNIGGSSIGVDSAGNIYIPGSHENGDASFFRYSSTGVLTAEAGGFLDFTVTPDGTVYASDQIVSVYRATE